MRIKNFICRGCCSNPKEKFLFTVNDSGKKVKFAPGNLYWDGNDFHFEEHQYDSPTIYNPKHVAHFFWSKDARVACAANYDDAYAQFGTACATTDNFFASDGGAIQGYTMLSKEEWQYLLKNATAKKAAVINFMFCVILKPDGFKGEVKDWYTAEEWTKAETSGLVALPLAGCCADKHIWGDLHYGRYWSGTLNEDFSFQAWVTLFPLGRDLTNYKTCRDESCSIRLVQVQQSSD